MTCIISQPIKCYYRYHGPITYREMHDVLNCHDILACSSVMVFAVRQYIRRYHKLNNCNTHWLLLYGLNWWCFYILRNAQNEEADSEDFCQRQIFSHVDCCAVQICLMNNSDSAGFKYWLNLNCFCPKSRYVNHSVYVLDKIYPVRVKNTMVVFGTQSHLLQVQKISTL